MVRERSHDIGHGVGEDMDALLTEHGANTLVLVHRTELLKQWQERLPTFLGVGKGVVGTIGCGKAKPTGMIDIAEMQSLSRQGEVKALVESYGQIGVFKACSGF